MMGRFALMFFVLLFTVQHSVICWGGSSSQFSGESSNFIGSHHADANGNHIDSAFLETNCTQPCHLSSMKTTRFVFSTSHHPEVSNAFQESSLPKGIISPIFHPPRFVSFPAI